MKITQLPLYIYYESKEEVNLFRIVLRIYSVYSLFKKYNLEYALSSTIEIRSFKISIFRINYSK